MSEELNPAGEGKSHLDNLTDNQLLRCFIFERFDASEFGGFEQVKAMDMIFEWIRNGVVPADPKAPKPKLKAVE